jgi:hypothetical protein
MDKTQDPILNALQQAGEPIGITDEMVELDEDRITSDTEVSEEVFLYKIYGTPCFPRCDLTTVAGPPKSGKTFLISMLMACGVKRKVLELERVSEEPLKVLWFDTEQSISTTKHILVNRVGRMIRVDGKDTFPDSQYYVFNTRNRTPKERLNRLTLAVETYKPDICIVDGIADMMEDINSGTESIELMQRLLAMAAENNCNMTAIIHVNRSGEKLNLRGWIGSVMLQKSYEVFNCESVTGTHSFSVGMTFSRRHFLDQAMYYSISDEGIPYTAGKPDIHGGNGHDKSVGKETVSIDKFNKEFTDGNAADSYLPWNFRKLFTAAFNGAAMLGFEELEKRTKELSSIRQKQYYYRVLAEAERQRIVKKVMTKGGRVGVLLLPPQ